MSSVLSSHSPSVFLSGVGELRETGWWKRNPTVSDGRADFDATKVSSLNRSIELLKRVLF